MDLRSYSPEFDRGRAGVTRISCSCRNSQTLGAALDFHDWLKMHVVIMNFISVFGPPAKDSTGAAGNSQEITGER